jgi:hypothetical protein
MSREMQRSTKKNIETEPTAVADASPTATPQNDNGIDTDFVWGVIAIGACIGLNERRAYHAIARGQLPGVTKINGRYVGRRSVLKQIGKPAR